MPTYDPTSEELGQQASVFVTARYDRDSGKVSVLKNIRCESIHYVEGITPPSAQFSYVMDDNLDGYPYLLEDIFPLESQVDGVVQLDDELLVYEYQGDTRTLVFDGFAQVPQGDLGQGSQFTFTAVGVAIRLWDKPIRGAIIRQSNAPNSTAKTDAVSTDLPVWFNPTVKEVGRPNCIPDGYDINNGATNAYPIFFDPTATWVDGSGNPLQTFWTLGKFIRYLFWTENPDETYLKNPVSPTGATIDDYLSTPKPKKGQQFMDLSRSSTYDLDPIIIRSFDVTGKTLPEAAEEQLSYYGYELFFNLRDDGSGKPINEIIVFRKDGRDGNKPKELFYPEVGSNLSDGVPDFQGFALDRDSYNAANEIEVESGPLRYEISVILSPGFVINASDASDANTMRGFDLSLVENDPTRKKLYRYFVVDENGEGHWDGSSFVVNTPTSLDDVLGKPDKDGNPAYVKRSRPGVRDLITTSLTDGTPFKADLAISRDYNGPSPALWDGSGTWRQLGDSGWKLDDDALGVWLTCDNPSVWTIPKQQSAIGTGDRIDVITSLAAPSGDSTKFYLCLTTVIEGDKRLSAVASKRKASPMKHAVRRLIDAREHFRKDTVDKSSNYSDAGTVLVRDDTDKALALAESIRLASEMPPISGEILIPWITHSIGVGDLISRVSGRDVSLLCNAGSPQGEGPRYPCVIGFSLNCQMPQSTTLRLSDRRAEPEGANHGYGHST
jgi:hypothetical protein